MPLGAHSMPAIATPLTARERLVLRLMCEGVPLKRIAREIGLSGPAGVSYYVAKLCKKTGCTSHAQLGAWAVLKGFVYTERWAVPAAHNANTTEGQASPRLGAAVSPEQASPARSQAGSGQARQAAPPQDEK